MDPSPPARPPAPFFTAHRSFVVLVIVLVIGYALFLRRYTSPYAGGSDSSGYLNSAALLLQGRLTTPKPVLPGHTVEEFGIGVHVPLGFITRAGTDEMTPTYPLGLPLHLVAFSWPFGLDWATVPLNICAALAGGGLLYLFARRVGLPPSWSLAGAVVLLVCPLYVFAATQPMSDLLALVWCLAALYAALRAREKWNWALACGFAVAWAVLVRPTDLLLVVPVALALGLAWRSYLWVGLGGLPGALLLAVYNDKVYGSPFITGYGGDIWSAFRGEFAAHNLPFFALWIPGLLSPLVVMALAAPFRPAGRQRELAVLGVWAVVLIGLYAFYYHSGETWWYLRFILPAFPVLILAALVALHSFLAAAPGRKIIAGVLLAAALAWEVAQVDRFDLTLNKSGEATYADSSKWAREHLPANAAIICMQVSGAVHYYTDFLVIRWEQVGGDDLRRLFRVLHDQQRPVYAVLYDFEEADAQRRMGGHWTKLTKIRNATVWQVDPPLTPP